MRPRKFYKCRSSLEIVLDILSFCKFNQNRYKTNQNKITSLCQHHSPIHIFSFNQNQLNLISKLRNRVSWKAKWCYFVLYTLLIGFLYQVPFYKQIIYFRMLSKKKLTEIFLRKEDRSTQSTIPFDENYFDLHCEFNGTNYSLISISATILKGEKSKQKLNLKCRWYIKTADDFKQIPQITGSYYQPCLEDVGSIISVQIQPFMEDKEYEGVTLIKQFGPIKIDSKLQQFQSVITKSKMYNVNVKLQTISSHNQKYSELELPTQGTLIMTDGSIELLSSGYSLFKYQIEGSSITTESIRRTPNSLLLAIGDQTFRLTTQNNIKRDELTITVKIFTSRLVIKQSKLDHLLRIQELIKNNNLLKKQLETTKIQHEYSLKSKIVLKEEVEILKQKLKQYDALVLMNDSLKSQNSKIIGQNSFLINQISIYKKEDKEKQTTISQLRQEIVSLNQKLSMSSKQIQDVELKCQQKIDLSLLEFKNLQRDSVKQKHEKEELQLQLQNRGEEFNRLERKYNSLVQDRLAIDDSKSKKEHMQNQIQIQALKSQIFNLESLLAKHKNQQKQSKHIWDLKQLIAGLKFTKNNSQATSYLQKLVANLTQTVTEKQLQLSNQRQSNKILNIQLLKYKSKQLQPK